MRALLAFFGHGAVGCHLRILFEFLIIRALVLDWAVASTQIEVCVVVILELLEMRTLFQRAFVVVLVHIRAFLGCIWTMSFLFLLSHIILVALLIKMRAFFLHWTILQISVVNIGKLVVMRTASQRTLDILVTFGVWIEFSVLSVSFGVIIVCKLVKLYMGSLPFLKDSREDDQRHSRYKLDTFLWLDSLQLPAAPIGK